MLRLERGQSQQLAGDVGLGLVDARLQQPDLALDRTATLGELALLVEHRRRGLRHAAARHDLGREDDPFAAVELGHQAGLLRQRRIELLLQDIGVGLCLDGLQPEQHLALLHALGLGDHHLADDAAFQMLDHFLV